MFSNNTAAYWREKLKLIRHVEGGSFKEVYRSSTLIARSALPPAFKADRPAGTSIYFLLEDGEFSAFHRIAADEIWHFYDGQTLSIYEIEPGGILRKHLLGKEEGAELQVVIPGGSWFASVVENAGGFTLCGCTVAPGFDFDDFELADRETLSQAYPAHRALIARLTYTVGTNFTSSI